MLEDAKEHFSRANEMLLKVKESLSEARATTVGFEALSEIGDKVEAVEDQMEAIEERLNEIESLESDMDIEKN